MHLNLGRAEFKNSSGLSIQFLLVSNCRHNGIGVKEVLRKQFLDGAKHSLLHRVIWCCGHVITIRHLQVYGKDKR